MRILLLSRYDRLGASSRLRTMQYLPALADAGMEVSVAPFFDDEYLRRQYAGKGRIGSTIGAFSRRLRQLSSVRAFDLVWLEKEALPWLPWPLERMLAFRGVPVVTDYDDAIFHRYERHRSGIVRRLLGDRIDRVMAASGLVVAGNAYLAERAEAAGAKRVVIVPTVVDTAAYATGSRSSDVPSIGWIGTPRTWEAYMAPMIGLLAQIAEGENAVIRAVGAGRVSDPPSCLEILDWREDREVGMIQSMDIGIMPLDDSPWSRGKCGYKLIQYMACGLPVVASPVGVNAEIVEHGINGFLASSDAEWRKALTTLLRDPDLRRRMGDAGRRKVEREYSLAAQAPNVVRLLREAASANSRT